MESNFGLQFQLFLVIFFRHVMSNALKRIIVLELNKNWQRTKFRTIAKAITSLCIDRTGIPNMLVVPLGPEGIEGHPVDFDEWIKLPVRSFDIAILTARGAIRAPLAVIASNYDRMPVKEPELSKDAILERDDLIDQYTGEKLTRAQATVDHVIPKHLWQSRGLGGSPHRWDNMVTCKDDRNHKKVGKLNFQAGLKLIRKPKAPAKVPIHCLIRKPRHPFQLPLFNDVIQCQDTTENAGR